MANVRRIINNMLIVAGLLTEGVSIVDAIRNTTLRDALNRRREIIQDLSNEMGVNPYYLNLEDDPIPITMASFEGRHTPKEKEKIYEEFSRKLNDRMRQIPIDPESKARTDRDLFGIATGFLPIGLGVLGKINGEEEIRKGKQFQETMRSRGGRGRERF